MPNLPVAKIVGHPGAQTNEEIREFARAVTAEQVIDNLLTQPDEIVLPDEPGPRDIVFAGSFEEVSAFFYEKQWSDGLPIVPPTIDKVEEFLGFTDRDPDEILGIALPESRAVTVWATAVNGVMAGCRPEYMPVLLALAEAMVDPIYGVEHSGNTPGAETLIVLNGPIIKELDFNYEQGVLRDGFLPNTSVGRFWRLALRNMAGFLPHKTDKGSFGNTFRVVLAENEDALAGIDWPSNAADMGFATGDNTVTITRMTGGGVFPSVTGSRPEQMMPYIADAVAAQTGWEIVFTVGGLSYGTLRPVLILTPILAETIAKAGWSKRDVKQYLFDHARMKAGRVETMCDEWTDFPIGSLKHQVNLGRLPKDFAESDDPERMVPIVVDPEDFMVLISGDPLRTNAYTFAHNGYLGFPVAKKIELPKDWAKRIGKKA
ncbi:MAG: hypothetical protein H6917_03860 [Novosphingobium sp.]|nr:hypothetical protein [Novosphingobium sp.]MCP5401508.1 hypothetical protein [Novosphingobium sp.]